jgi:acyl carrier protein
MTRDEIIEGLRELLKQQKQVRIDPAAIGLESRIDSLGFDSLSILDFIYDVEDRFQVQTQMGDLVQMERVGDLVTYIETRVVK